MIQRYLILTVILLTCGFSSQAQFFFGPTGGITVANYNLRGEDYGERNASSENGGIGYRFGATGYVKGSDYVHFQFGGYFDQYKMDMILEDEGGDMDTTISTNVHFINVPLSVVGGYAFNDYFELQAKLGPTFSFGMYGRNSYDYDNPISDNETNYMNFGPVTDESPKDGDFDSWGRVNVMAHAGIQVRTYRYFLIGFEYNLGLLNMFPGYRGNDSDIEDAVEIARSDYDFNYNYFNISLAVLLNAQSFKD